MVGPPSCKRMQDGFLYNYRERGGVAMFEKMNERLRKLDVVDIGLVKWTVFFAAIIIVKIFPQLLKINYTILVLLTIACGARPLYRFWIKK